MILPISLFSGDYSTALSDSKGNLISAKIAPDGQWRFPEVDSVPAHLSAAICYFEDEYFYYHPGFNPISMFRALKQNIASGKVISGGSTLSMQLVRLSSQRQKRSYLRKLVEVIKAFKIELHYSKDEILCLYASHAPYGGNVVGAEAASWRYFSRPLHQLSWAEYALLAVLPNSPSLMHPGRNRESLLRKRNMLLHKLYRNQEMDSITYSLSILERIPDAPRPLPDNASHLLDFAIRNGKQGQRLSTTIDISLQSAVTSRLDSYVGLLAQSEIRNACAIVVSLKDGAVKAYIGNTSNSGSGARFVDLIQAQRSSGSILKPFLYGVSIDAGIIHPNTLLRDVPISIDKFSPTNFDKQFDGVVPSGEALAHSLNVPAALLLRDYGILPFYQNLKQLGFSTINRSAGDYGLSLILGGAEATLWDLARIYAYQAMLINQFRMDTVPVRGLELWEDSQFAIPTDPISVGAWWLVSEALTDVKRPDLDKNWKLFSSSRRISWKTGTSHGFRDAWAVGYDSGYLVAVWVGNAEGDGRPGLTGASVAGPLMFQIFQLLPRSPWFVKPMMSLRYVTLCAHSGFSPGPYCPTVEAEMPMDAKIPATCTMHQMILVNEYGKRVNLDCATGEVHDTVWFALDPVAAHYYRKKHLNYRPLPPFSIDCKQISADQTDILYPPNLSKIIIPRGFNGTEEALMLEATHVYPDALLYWHLDDVYLGATSQIHKIPVHISIGKHILKIMDEAGNSATSKFVVYK